MLTGLLIIAGCGKEDDITYSNTPVIELINISQDTIRQYEDVLIIRIAYKDGDGDVGFEDPEEYALYVRDIRLEAFDGFYVGPLAPPDANVPIQGELTIAFPSLFLFGNGAVEQTRFEIKMIDRAGHESNVLETEFVAITRE
ncbi:MAG: hypothetical protein SH808_06340 [Saprospiraceae bacterium]|mgnify:FL=1|nr:hypothetical protein [Saprospiraceae bacterium]